MPTSGDALLRDRPGPGRGDAGRPAGGGARPLAVENGLHFIKDRWWDEDRHYSTRPGVALGFAVLLNAVVTVLRATADPEDDLPLRHAPTPWAGMSSKRLTS